jgi:hypothetical protein
MKPCARKLRRHQIAREFFGWACRGLRERGRSILDSRGPLWPKFRAALMFARAVRLRSYDAVFPEGDQAVVADWLLLH